MGVTEECPLLLHVERSVSLSTYHGSTSNYLRNTS